MMLERTVKTTFSPRVNRGVLTNLNNASKYWVCTLVIYMAVNGSYYYIPAPSQVKIWEIHNIGVYLS